MTKTNARVETLGDVAFRNARSGEITEVVSLLEQGASADAPDRNGFTALTRAAQFDHLELVRVLLVAGADPNIANKWGLTPLMISKSVVVAEALLASGAAVNAVTLADGGGRGQGKTALMNVAGNGHLPVVRVLLAHGADLEMRDAEGRNALIFSAANRCGDISQALLAAGATVGLVEAALLGDVKRVKEILQSEPNLHADVLGHALWWAAGNGRAEAVRLLIDCGADVNARMGRGVTALIQAALMGRTEVVSLLLACGADVIAYDGRGATALHASLVSTVHGCKRDVILALLEAGAEVNAPTHFSWPTHTGGTALMEAALRGATDCAQALIDYGADLELSSAIDEDGVGGWTALVAAVANNRLETIRLLIESGADVNNGGEGGQRALEIARSRARRTGNMDIVDLLVSVGGRE